MVLYADNGGTLRAIPNFFFLEDKLYEKIKIIQSEDVVVAFDYEEMSRVWLSRPLTAKTCQKAYSIAQAASVLRVKPASIKDALKDGLTPTAVVAYNQTTLKPTGFYFKESDLFELRDAIWELLPKNRYGEPYRDTMVSERELKSILAKENPDIFTVRDGEIIAVFKS